MKLKKIRNALLVVLTLALVSATTVAITWALGEKQTELDDAKVNNFTNNPNIGLEFQERTFDSLPYGTDRTSEDSNVPKKTDELPYTESGGNKTYTIQLPDGTALDHGDDLGYHIARSYTVNTNIPKNPQLRNGTNAPSYTSVFDNSKELNGSTSDEWVAMGVKYKMTIPTTVYEKNDGNDAHDGSAANDDFAIVVAAVTAGHTDSAFAGDEVTFAEYDDFKEAIAQVKYAPNDNEALASMTKNFRLGTTEDSETWKDISSPATQTLFMYNKKLVSIPDYNAAVAENANTTARNETKPLFDAVQIENIGQKYVKVGGGYLYLYELHVKAKASQGTGGFDKYLYVSTLPDFKIQLTGYAVQADNVDYSDAPQALRDFAASVS